MKQLKNIHLVRRDLGNLLFHFTRRTAQTTNILTGEVEGEDRNAMLILNDIIKGKTLKGGTGYIKGSHRCICFSESPISELASLFNLDQSNNIPGRYEPYGIAVPKDWLYKKGGRPVIYQSEQEYKDLPKSMQFRHVTYSPPEQDFSWEREWRIKADELTLDPTKALVIVPTAPEAAGLNHLHSDDLEEAGVRGRTYQKPHWMIVSLDLFGLTPTTSIKAK